MIDRHVHGSVHHASVFGNVLVAPVSDGRCSGSTDVQGPHHDSVGTLFGTKPDLVRIKQRAILNTLAVGVTNEKLVVNVHRSYTCKFSYMCMELLRSKLHKVGRPSDLEIAR